MAGFQFIHYEAYARTGNAKKRSYFPLHKKMIVIQVATLTLERLKYPNT